MDSETLSRLPTLRDCVHCGLCLPDCPTYAVTAKEAESPRGRIAAIRALAEERTELTPALRRGLEDCLVCRACESACPSGISMDALMAGYRHEAKGRGGGALIERFVLQEIIPRPEPIALASRVGSWLWPLLRRLPLDVPARHRLRKPPPLPEELTPEGEPRGRVVVLRGCIADRWFRRETLRAGRILAHQGWHVLFPPSGCCGALHRHAGLLDRADALRRETARAVLEPEPDHIVVDSAGCSAWLAERHGDVDPGSTELAGKITDTLGLLWRGGWEAPPRRLDGHWALAPACHQRHGPLSEEPMRRVLDTLLVEEWRELPEPAHCCGAAGFYLLRRPGLSREIGRRARERFARTGATGVISANPGCLIRWETLLRAPGGPRVEHPVSLVAECLGLDRVEK